MAKTAANVPVTVVPGGDSYLNDARTKALCAQALKARPDAELIELDATSADQYAFDEAVSPSLLSDVAVVKLVNLQNADEKLAEALVTYTKQAAKDPNGSSVVICQHEGGVKGRKIIDQLVKAGARKEDVPDLKKPDAQLNFVLGEFEKRGRRVEPMAAQQLVSVLGGKTGELAAMCEQLCFDFEDNPIGLDRANQYLTANPQVTGFAVADKAVEGRTAEAIVMMRAAVEQGTDPIAFDWCIGYEAQNHRQGIGRTCRNDFAGRGENQSLGAQKCDAPTRRVDFSRSCALHPHARLGR